MLNLWLFYVYIFLDTALWLRDNMWYLLSLLFILFTTRYTIFPLWCPLRGLWWSEQFHCQNIRQSHVGSTLTGSLRIFRPCSSAHGVSDLWFLLGHAPRSGWLSGILKCLHKTWCIISISLNRWDVALLCVSEKESLTLCHPFFPSRLVNFRW